MSEIDEAIIEQQYQHYLQRQEAGGIMWYEMYMGKQ